MDYSRTLTPVCSLLATAFLAFAQTPPPAAIAPAPPAAWEQTPAPAAAPRPAAAPVAAIAPADIGDQIPPAPPAPPAPPSPAVAPMAPLPPLPPMDFDLSDINPEIQMKLDMVREQVENMKFDMKFDMQDGALMKEQMMAAKDMAMDAMRSKLGFAFAPQAAAAPRPPMPPVTPKAITFRGRNMSDDRLYSAGQGALDSRQWDEAVEYFGQVVSRNGARVDGALYWKAYALGKLGRRDEANAAIAELRKSYAGSRWLDDAKALELELKQASGQSVSPEGESDEELKLMAINGLMQSDPERAIPLLEGQLKGSASPKVKRNTLFVLAQSNSPKAQALLEQIARGGANPDLQVKAITYMDQRRRPNNNPQLLSEIYTSTN